jgi:hypothetical protein
VAAAASRVGSVVDPLLLAIWALGAAGGGLGCHPDAGPADLETPDVTRVLVYFPVGEGGLVRGRAFPGTFSSGAAVPWAVIRSHPTSLRPTVVPVAADGGFDFSVVASGREVLEIAGATEREAALVGPSVFVEVPAVPVPPATFRCCRNPGSSAGACLTESEWEERLDPITGLPVSCPTEEPRPVSRCETDRECVVLSRRYYEIDATRFEVSAPNEDGEVVVRGEPGAVIANGLVIIENRGGRGVGRDDPALRRSIIADADGSFASAPFEAKGDDEIVVEFLDLNDFRSPTLSLFVPDPPLESAQIVEIWPSSDLSNQLGGFVGVRFWLTGRDGRGLCPDAPSADPAYCVSGGLVHDHVQIVRAFLDRPDQTVALCPPLREGEAPPDAPPCGGPGVERLVAPTAVRGVEGDVRGPPRDIALVVDVSRRSAHVAARGRYFAALSALVERLRARDRVGLFALGPDTWSTLLSRDAAQAELDALARAPATGARRPFVAVREAARALGSAGSTRGRIVVTALGGADRLPDEADPDDPYNLALEAVQPGVIRGAPGYPVDIVGVNLSDPPPGAGPPEPRARMMTRLLESLAAFSGPVGSPGRNYGSVGNVLDLRLRLRDVAGQLTGGFNLLYELVRQPDGVQIEDRVGKLGELQVEAALEVPTGRADLRYAGPLEFKKLITP